MPSTLLILAGWATFVTSLPMVAADTNMGGELLRGYEVRGYQCFMGAFIAPLARPLATPLWVMAAGGNLTALLAPLVVRWAFLARAGRILLSMGAVGACALWVIGPVVGVARLYPGYYVWCAGLLILTLGVWPVNRAGTGETK